MHIETLPITIHIAKPKMSFLKDYSKRHQISTSQLIDDLIEQLRISEEYQLHPQIREISGLLPAEIDGKDEYSAHF